MSQLITVALIILALVAVALLNDPAKSSRCCGEPSHRDVKGDSEIVYCAKRGS